MLAATGRVTNLRPANYHQVQDPSHHSQRPLKPLHRSLRHFNCKMTVHMCRAASRHGVSEDIKTIRNTSTQLVPMQ